MAETSFIKTVVFGGYDKSETDSLFEALNLKICDLENELRQTKLLLDGYKSDSDAEKSFESVLSAERAELSRMQVQNETLTAKNNELTSAARDNELEIKSLKAEVDGLKKELAAANELLGEAAGDGDAALSEVYIEAQRSADALKEEARTEAEALRKDAVRLAENVISEANENAARIIRNAEKKAEEMNRSNDVKSIEAAIDRRNGVIEDIAALSEQFRKLRELIDTFEKDGKDCIRESEILLVRTTAAVGSMEPCAVSAPPAVTEKAAVSEPADVTDKAAGETAPVQEERPAEEPNATDAKSEESSSLSDELDMLMAMAEALNDD